jgi:hypothetical protein
VSDRYSAISTERTGQPVNSVSSLAQTHSGQAIKGADNSTAVVSALSADALQVGDPVVLVSASNERCQGRELTAIWTVRRIDAVHVVLVAESI